MITASNRTDAASLSDNMHGSETGVNTDIGGIQARNSPSGEIATRSTRTSIIIRNRQKSSPDRSLFHRETICHFDLTNGQIYDRMVSAISIDTAVFQ